METKRITIQFGDRALGSYSADSLQVMMESIEDSFRDCNDKLSGAQMAVSDYVFQADAITEMTENMLKLQAYASTAHEQVYQELDRPLWQDFKDNATESLSQIVLDELSTENTFGMEEHYEVAAIEVEYGQKRVKTELTMRDFMGLPAVEAEEGMPVLEHVEIVGRFAGLFRAEYLEKSQYMDVDKFVEAYLTNGEYLHSAYHPGKDFLSGLLDITIVKPVIESLTGEDMITKERLSDSERAFKAAGAMIDLFTFGQGTLMIDFMGYTGKEALEVFGRTVLVDVFANSAAYTVSYGADAMGLPPEINWILSVTTGCTISVAGGDYILKGLDGSVTKITAADVREIAKGNIKDEWKRFLGDNRGRVDLGGSASVVDDVVEGGLDASIKNIDEFIGGNKSFDDVLDDYAKVYADKINSNQAWSWDDTIPGGENLTKKQRSIIKQQAIDAGLIPDIKVTKVEGMRYGFADFESAGVVKETQYLPENMWKMSDAEQFKWLDEQIGGTVDGYTWHHTEIPGKMQLVPTGIHNITTHNGGRTAGMWADAPR